MKAGRAKFPGPEKPHPGLPARGFTLVELLVVIVIVAILASIAIPSFRGLGDGSRMAVAKRQLIDDIHLARSTALKDRTDVYVVFADPHVVRALTGGLFDPALGAGLQLPANHPFRPVLTNLAAGQLRSYALYASNRKEGMLNRPAGRFLTEWKSLPEGILLPPRNFDWSQRDAPNEISRCLPRTEVEYTAETGSKFRWSGPTAAIGFDSEGRLIDTDRMDNRITPPRDQILALAFGSVLVARTANGGLDPAVPADVRITPPDNFTNHFLRVNWLTGRATEEAPRTR